jgi:hypothetical protein
MHFTADCMQQSSQSFVNVSCVQIVCDLLSVYFPTFVFENTVCLLQSKWWQKSKVTVNVLNLSDKRENLIFVER